MRRAIIVSAALLAACLPAEPTKISNGEVKGVMAHYAALLNGAPPNADSVSAMYAPDGELLPNGRDAIAARPRSASSSRRSARCRWIPPRCL